jgi:hypothetical protein
MAIIPHGMREGVDPGSEVRKSLCPLRYQTQPAIHSHYKAMAPPVGSPGPIMLSLTCFIGEIIKLLSSQDSSDMAWIVAQIQQVTANIVERHGTTTTPFRLVDGILRGHTTNYAQLCDEFGRAFVAFQYQHDHK